MEMKGLCLASSSILYLDIISNTSPSPSYWGVNNIHYFLGFILILTKSSYNYEKFCVREMPLHTNAIFYRQSRSEHDDKEYKFHKHTTMI